MRAADLARLNELYPEAMEPTEADARAAIGVKQPHWASLESEIFADFTATPDRIQASTGTGLVSIGVPPTVYYNVTARTQAEATVNVPTRTTSRHTINLSDGVGDIVVVMGYPAASNAAGMQNVNWPSWATRGT